MVIQADELTKLISRIRKGVQQIKENNNAMLTAYNNQGQLNTQLSVCVLLYMRYCICVLLYVHYCTYVCYCMCITVHMCVTVCVLLYVGAKEKNDRLNEEIKSLTRKVHAQFKSMFKVFLCILVSTDCTWA